MTASKALARNPRSDHCHCSSGSDGSNARGSHVAVMAVTPRNPRSDPQIASGSQVAVMAVRHCHGGAPKGDWGPRGSRQSQMAPNQTSTPPTQDPVDPEDPTVSPTRPTPWTPELAGPIVRPVIDRTVAELIDRYELTIAALATANPGVNAKTVENVVSDLVGYGAIRRVGRTGVVRLTTLGRIWANDWLEPPEAS